MSTKVKPVCPACKTEGNMAGTMDGPIFCATCGWHGTAEQIWKSMQDRMPPKHRGE